VEAGRKGSREGFTGESTVGEEEEGVDRDTRAVEAREASGSTSRASRELPEGRGIL